MARALFLLPLLAALAVPVQGAVTVVSVDAPGDPLRVGLDVGDVAVNLAVDCTSVLLRPNPGAVLASIPLSVSPWTGAATVTVAGQSEVPVPVEPCAAGAQKVSVTARFTASVDDQALGGAPQQVQARFSLANATGGADPASATATVTLVAAPFRVAAFEVGMAARECACDRVGFLVRIDNQGNVPTGYRFEVARAPPLGTVELPAEVEVQPPQAGGAHAVNVTLAYVGPGGDWGEQPFQVRVVALANGSPVGEGTILGFLALHVVEKKDSPAPAALLVAPLLLGLAAARRRLFNF